MAADPALIVGGPAVRSIPIRNVYYLLLYAWDQFTPKNQAEVGVEAGPDLPNLLGKVLAEGTRRLLRRGSDRGYIGWVDELIAPRGRFLLAEAIKRSSFVRGRLICQFDELSPDVVHNRILKAALATLARSEMIEASLAAELNDLRAKLAGVTEVALSKQLFKQLQLSRNISHYSLLMKICELVRELLLPEEGGRGSRFADILREEEQMSSIFEAFVRNFYRREQNQFSVFGPEGIPWDMSPDSVGHAAYLPSMFTDVTLRSPTRTIVIDAKFYLQTLVVGRFGSQSKVRSAHLYQLMSYLMNMAKREGPDAHAEGLLLYPCTDGHTLRLEFHLIDHKVSAFTVDLTQPWPHIHEELLTMILR